MTSSLTLKGIPDELLEQLRTDAERERRSLNQQAIWILEQAMRQKRETFLQRLQVFYDTEGAPEEGGGEWDDVRSKDPGRDGKI